MLSPRVGGPHCVELVDVWFRDVDLPRTLLRVSGTYLVQPARPFRIHIRFDEDEGEDEGWVQGMWNYYRKSVKKGLLARAARYEEGLAEALRSMAEQEEPPIEFLSEYNGDGGYYESLNYECARFVVDAAQWAMKEGKGYTLVDPFTQKTTCTWPQWTGDAYVWAQLPAWDGTTMRMRFAGTPVEQRVGCTLLDVDARPPQRSDNNEGLRLALAKRTAIHPLTLGEAGVTFDVCPPIAQHVADEVLPPIIVPAKPKVKNKEHKVEAPRGTLVADARSPFLAKPQGVKRKAYDASEGEPTRKKAKQQTYIIPRGALVNEAEVKADEMVDQLRAAFREALGASSSLGYGAPPRPPHLMAAPPLKPLAHETLVIRPAVPPSAEQVAELTQRIKARLPADDAPLRVNVRRIPSIAGVLELKWEVWPGLWPTSS